MAINRRDLIVRGGATAAALTAGGAAAPASAQTGIPTKWDHTADVVVIGGGATGIPAAIAAREAGSSVILVEAQPHVGGHARVSGGNVPLGGGTSGQKKYGIEDSPHPFVHRRTTTQPSPSRGEGTFTSAASLQRRPLRFDFFFAFALPLLFPPTSVLVRGGSSPALVSRVTQYSQARPSGRSCSE